MLNGHAPGYCDVVDALAAVLATAGVRGTIAATLNAADPWGFGLDDIPGAAFHAVTEGTAWLCLPGRPDIRLLPGDVASKFMALPVSRSGRRLVVAMFPTSDSPASRCYFRINSYC